MVIKNKNLKNMFILSMQILINIYKYIFERRLETFEINYDYDLSRFGIDMNFLK
jgi:hypothetical protein